MQIKIPYETGMDPYSGMVEMLEAKDSGNTIQILISTDDAFDFTRKPLLLTDEVKQAS